MTAPKFDDWKGKTWTLTHWDGVSAPSGDTVQTNAVDLKPKELAVAMTCATTHSPKHNRPGKFEKQTDTTAKGLSASPTSGWMMASSEETRVENDVNVVYHILHAENPGGGETASWTAERQG